MYEKYLAYSRQIEDLRGIQSLVSWDQEVMMPKDGARFRSQQISTLAGILHEKRIDPAFGDLLQQLSQMNGELTWEQKKNIELSLSDYQKAVKFPTEFIQRYARLRSEAFQAWMKSREENNFKTFAPSLENLLELVKEQAEILGYEDHPYDALIDSYDPGTKTKKLEAVFSQVRERLVPFYQAVLEKPKPDNSFMYRKFDEDKQWQFGIDILKQMGYDFNKGRQDKAPHPFSTHFNPDDVRVTTRVSENNFLDMTWSTIHEGGHALYELGMLEENYGIPAGSASGLSIHESQSRMWENNVGRSLAFWKANYKDLQSRFPDALGDVSLDQFYKGINKVEPSLIRVDADELSYHLHILVRFEMEKALVEGSLAVADAEEAWNEKYKEYLLIDVPNPKQGVLQDIHWSHGSMGYFPTYSLGSFYAAQFFAKAEKEIPSLSSEIETGNCSSLLSWLRENIHRHGRLYNAEELSQRITGEGLNLDHFMAYAQKKFGEIYGI